MISERDSMSKTDKLIAKIEDYRKSCSITFSELEQYLNIYGFKRRGTKGSHAIFCHPLLPRPLPIPIHGNTVKAAYVKKAIELVQTIKDNEEGGS